jgi:hypothetical protein
LIGVVAGLPLAFDTKPLNLDKAPATTFDIRTAS